MLINILALYQYDAKMKRVYFYINEEEYKEAIRKLGNARNFYGFAKKAFLEALKNA